jgi:two-component system sensor histidine kinase KdpD
METPPREPGRKTPEEILESLEREARGKLTIYLGSSAGVGKTYSMLEAARERKSSAIDVVVGWIETHGRKETEKLAEGLERVPPLVLDYKGKSFNEMDLDGVLERKPGLVLVDELAHTNVAGSRHARRFQDVEELLRAGINVYTTINIQHVESLNDVVAQITGILVRETVPDRIVEEADFIRLIDISADELISRLKEGKVYVPAQAEQALLKFFRPGNLNALRELAMRFAARRVDREISGYMKEHHIEGPWPMGGNVMVCVSGSPFSAQLIRAAFQLSQGLRSEWLAVHVESGRRHFPMGDRERARLEKNMRLAEELGAKTFTAVGENLVREILDIARVHNVSALVVGKPRHNRLWDFVYGSLVDELIRKSEKLNIYVIQAGEARESAPVIKTGTSVGGFNWKHHAGSLFMVAIITALGLHFREELNHLNIAFLYLLVVVLSASWWGRWPSYTAAVTGVALFDFLFIPPIYTFSVHDLRYMWSFAIFLVVAFIIGGKTESLRKEAQAARLREKSTRTLYEFGREIAGVMDLRMISRELCREVAETLEREVVVLFPGREGELTPASCYSPFLRNGDREMLDLHSVPMARRMLDGFTQAVASWTFKNARVAGRSTETFSECPFLFLPLLAKGKAEGVLGINLGEQELLPEQWRLLETWVKLAAIAIERATLQEQAQETALIVESERLHTALFNSLSHELKTPLASIIGSVSTLIESSEIYSSWH